MAKQTLQQQLCAGLLHMGMWEMKPTSKYRRFMDIRTKHQFFVGKSGALRCSRSGKATVTFVVGDNYRKQVLEAGSLVVADPAKLGY